MRKLIIALGLLSSSSVFAANSIDYLAFSSQANFKSFAEDLTAALDHKPLVPAEPLGVTGFDLGLAISNQKFSTALTQVEITPVENSLQMLTFQAHKGLPFGVDVGAAYSMGVGGNLSTLSWEVGYAILKGSVALPAVTAKYTSTSMSGTSKLSYESSAIDIGISKGFTIFTPYAGVASVSSKVSAKSSNSTLGGGPASLSSVSSSLFKTYLGVNINLGLSNLLLDMTNVGNASAYTFKYGFRF